MQIDPKNETKPGKYIKESFVPIGMKKYPDSDKKRSTGYSKQTK